MKYASEVLGSVLGKDHGVASIFLLWLKVLCMFDPSNQTPPQQRLPLIRNILHQSKTKRHLGENRFALKRYWKCISVVQELCFYETRLSTHTGWLLGATGVQTPPANYSFTEPQLHLSTLHFTLLIRFAALYWTLNPNLGWDRPRIMCLQSVHWWDESNLILNRNF